MPSYLQEAQNLVVAADERGADREVGQHDDPVVILEEVQDARNQGADRLLYAGVVHHVVGHARSNITPQYSSREVLPTQMYPACLLV